MCSERSGQVQLIVSLSGFDAAFPASCLVHKFIVTLSVRHVKLLGCQSEDLEEDVVNYRLDVHEIHVENKT